MKTFYWIIIIAILLGVIGCFQKCASDRQDKINELISTTRDEQYLRDIVILKSKIKSYSEVQRTNRVFQDSIITLNKRLAAAENNRVKISTIKPSKIIDIEMDYKPTVQDTGTYVSWKDYDSTKNIGIEAQKDLSGCIELNEALDSTIQIERSTQALKDTATTSIISMQQEALIEKEKEKQKLQKKLKVSNFFLRVGAVVIGVLSVIAAIK